MLTATERMILSEIKILSLLYKSHSDIIFSRNSSVLINNKDFISLLANTLVSTIFHFK